MELSNLLNVLPLLEKHNCGDRGLVHSEFSSEGCLGFSIDPASSYLRNLPGREFGASGAFATRHSLRASSGKVPIPASQSFRVGSTPMTVAEGRPPLDAHVFGIIGLGAQKEMIVQGTRRIVAGVAHQETGRGDPVPILINNPVNPNHSALMANEPIPILIGRAWPDQTVPGRHESPYNPIDKGGNTAGVATGSRAEPLPGPMNRRSTTFTFHKSQYTYTTTWT